MLPRIFLQRPVEWALGDVEQLVIDQIPEGQRIDYKAVLEIDTKSQRAEVAKDVSGMANAQGGWLLFGIAEDDSDEPRPKGITPFEVGDLLTRLENILDSALEPIPELEAASLDSGNGLGVIALYVNKISGRPVMVQGYGQNRYFLRSGTRTRPMSANEVAHAHTLASIRAEQVLDRLHDLPLISNPSSGISVPTMDDMVPTPVVSTLVAVIDGSSELVGRSHIRGNAFHEDREGCRRREPLRRGGTWTINNFGLIEEERQAPPPEPTLDSFSAIRWVPVDETDDRLKVYRLAIYRAGVIEWIRRYRDAIPSRSLVDDVHDVLLFAARVFDKVGYSGRLMTWIRVDHAENAELAVAEKFDVYPPAPGIETVDFSTEVTTDRLLSDPMPIVREAMDALWQAFGIERCLLFGNTGRLVD